MKGSREKKDNGNKVAGPALFPRLHVSDTKKAGPRGPPRNKMALYEQLTVPSHKYKPSLVPLPSAGRMTSMTTPMYQPQMQASSYDSRYSYMPMGYMSTMIPTMGYMPMMNMGLYSVAAGATATSSMNGSSARSTVVEASTESQRVPWGGETFSCQNNSSGQSKLSAPSKKRKENDDFAVPTYSSATQASSQALSTNPFHDRQGFSGGWAVQKGKEIALGNRSSACMDQARRITKGNCMEDDASWTSASAECETVSAIDDDVSTLELSYRNMGVCPRGSDGSTLELNISESGQERVKKHKVVADRSGEGFNRQSTTTTRVAVPPELVHAVDSLMAVPEQDIFSCRSSENRSGEVSEQSQPMRESSAETESSIGSINFLDVVDAFGQQEFWKAQSTIKRQQKIFSKQLFELHRVIQVQLLLGKTSSFSLNYEEALEEDEADNVHMPPSPVADVPEVPEVPEIPGRCPEANLNQPSNDNQRPVPEALPQPIYPLSVPYQENFNSGSAWQAMPYAANPWAARMSSPLMYAPYPGPCSPGYAAYPYMGMPMYGNSGGMQAARFPNWQQPDISQPWGAVESGAAAAWYGEQVVPPAAPMSNMGVVPPAFNSEHLTSLVDQQIQGSNASKGKGHARPSGEEFGVEVIAAKNPGWASGWGSTEERWDRGKCISGPSGNESDCAEGETGRGDGGYGQYKIREQVAVDEVGARDLNVQADDSSEPGSKQAELEAETIWPAGAGFLQSRTLKRTRPEGLDSDVISWFGMSSPAKRILQQTGVIKVVPRAATATTESAASILLSIQKERQR